MPALQNSYTVGILDRIGERYEMVPWDSKTLVKILVTPEQDTVWEYRDLASIQAIDNLHNNIPINLKQLLGEGAFSDLGQQS